MIVWRRSPLATTVRGMQRHTLIITLMLLAASVAQAKPWWMRGVEANDTDFLPPDVAFRMAARIDGNLVKVRWVIADGYYLYKQKIEVRPASPDLQVFAPQLPAGVMKTDPYLGTQEIYTQQVEATVAYTRIDAGAHPIEIKVTYQGCAEAGLCYPPITKAVFPNAGQPATEAQVPVSPWEGLAIVGGGIAFLLAGLVLRKGRKLDLPA
ncbi:MAG TPA: protein-disulfide reductase DsbD domain-containing protein [Steroidobacteraceae bacterium]